MSKKRVISESVPPPKPRLSATAWIQKHPTLIFVGLLALATLRIAATYSVFNHTADEPGHIAAGMQWLDQGVYAYESQHPPLARVAGAFGPFLAGRRSANQPDRDKEGVDILYGDGHYTRNLTLSRLGILPFFWISCFFLYVGARAGLGAPVALLAVFLYSFLPPVLAHAGLATTDMPLTAMLAASFVTGIMWLERPTTRRSVLFGACTGLAVLSKFSIFAFLPVTAVAALLCYLVAVRPSLRNLLDDIRRRLLPFLLAVAVAILVIWAGYRFSVGKAGFAGLTLPFPELFDGIRQVLAHNAQGHHAYLFGRRSQFGWWYYYPVVLAVKTPLPFLVLLFIGLGVSLRKSNRAQAAYWLPLAFSLGILFVSLTSHINIGVRHILPVYLGFSITAAIGAEWLYRHAFTSRWALWIPGVLLVWLCGLFTHQPSRLHSLYEPVGRQLSRENSGGFRSGLGPGYESPRQAPARIGSAPGRLQPVGHGLSGGIPRISAHYADAAHTAIARLECGEPHRHAVQPSRPGRPVSERQSVDGGNPAHGTRR